MENEELFKFMKKMYSDLKGSQEKMYSEMKEGFKELREDVKKNSIKLEALEKNVDTIAEVQQSHMKQNENQHAEIVEMLTERLDRQDTVIKNNIKAVY